MSGDDKKYNQNKVQLGIFIVCGQNPTLRKSDPDADLLSSELAERLHPTECLYDNGVEPVDIDHIITINNSHMRVPDDYDPSDAECDPNSPPMAIIAYPD